MNKELSYLVSNIDLQRKFKSTPDQIMIKLYPDLNGIEDIMTLLPSDVCVCFILLKQVNNQVIGHAYVVIIIYYFHSYGVAPDGEYRRKLVAKFCWKFIPI